MVGRRKKLTGVKRAIAHPENRKPKRTKFARILEDSEAALEDKDSPVFKEEVNLKAVLSHPKAQEVLRNAGLDPNIYQLPDFATAAARFKEDGRSGRHDPEWLRQALEASERRVAGDFDEYHQARFEQEWLSLEESGDELSGPTITRRAGRGLSDREPSCSQEAKQEVKTSEGEESAVR